MLVVQCAVLGAGCSVLRAQCSEKTRTQDSGLSQWQVWGLGECLARQVTVTRKGKAASAGRQGGEESLERDDRAKELAFDVEEILIASDEHLRLADDCEL